MERSEELKAGTDFQMTGTFDALTPERIFTAAETAMKARFSGVLTPLPSYINRVYEMERAGDGCRFVFKFYRPGRWTRAALLEEHLFTLECRAAEIPVIAPLRLGNGSTLAVSAGGCFSPRSPNGGGGRSKRLMMNRGYGSARCSGGSMRSAAGARRGTGCGSNRVVPRWTRRRGCSRTARPPARCGVSLNRCSRRCCANSFPANGRRR